jgi:cytochrome P450
MATYTLTRFRDVHDALCNSDLRQSLYDAGQLIMRDALLTLHGPPHKARRHLELKLFRRHYAYAYENTVFPRTLATILDPLIETGEADLVDFGYRVTMNLTADFAGIDRPLGSPEETAALLAITRKFSEGATLVHSDRDPREVIREVEGAIEDFRRFLAPSWARRARLVADVEAGRLPEAALPRDVLTALLRNQDRVELTDEIIEREIGFYLQAGSHSTANSLVHAVHEILGWTSDLARLRDDPLLLQRCVHESFRLHPASPVARRAPTRRTRLADGSTPVPGDRVILDLHSANRDPSVFGADAETYNPHRRVLQPKAEPYGLTFGAGVHMCIGRDLDGGVSQQATTNPDSHQYGIVTRLVQALLQNGVSAHPEKQPVRDPSTTRANWGYYPVLLAG